MVRENHTQSQLYPDRLEVISRGDLYGLIQPEPLGIPNIPSSRDELLRKIHEALPLPHDNQTLRRQDWKDLSQLRQAGISPLLSNITLACFKNHVLLQLDILSSKVVQTTQLPW